MAEKKKRRSRTITFRVPLHYWKELEEQGARFRMSAHEYARVLLLERLEESASKEMLFQMAVLKDNLAEVLEGMILHQYDSTIGEPRVVASRLVSPLRAKPARC